MWQASRNFWKSSKQFLPQTDSNDQTNQEILLHRTYRYPEYLFFSAEAVPFGMFWRGIMGTYEKDGDSLRL